MSRLLVRRVRTLLAKGRISTARLTLVRKGRISTARVSAIRRVVVAKGRALLL